jgi:hypothetical protein
MSGKGDKPRPLSISNDEFADRWDDIFKKKPPVKVKTPVEVIKNETNTSQ